MKKMKSFIICLILTASITGIHNPMNAQDKKAKKEAEKAMLTANFYAQDTVLNMKVFVLEADYLQGRTADMVIGWS